MVEVVEVELFIISNGFFIVVESLWGDNVFVRCFNFFSDIVMVKRLVEFRLLLLDIFSLMWMFRGWVVFVFTIVFFDFWFSLVFTFRFFSVLFLL